MTRIALALPALLLACAEAAPETDAEAIGGGGKVDVCHVTGSGAINVLNVSTSSVPAHLAHGDHMAGTYYLDGDGYGDSATTAECLYPGTVVDPGDCDEGDDLVNPGMDEDCDTPVDDDCDGEVDEGCSVPVDIFVAGDNAVWVWVDGVPVGLVANDGSGVHPSQPSWAIGMTASMDLSPGTHTVSYYVEDWGGIAYFASSVRADGQPVAVTGDGDFDESFGFGPQSNEYQTRIPYWWTPPASATDSINLLFDPGATWGDWMLNGFDASAWTSDTNVCTYPSYWNISQFVADGRVGYAEMYADGAEFVWPRTQFAPVGSCASTNYTFDWDTWTTTPADMAAVYRVEIDI